jgi:hypothetical protein
MGPSCQLSPDDALVLFDSCTNDNSLLPVVRLLPYMAVNIIKIGNI